MHAWYYLLISLPSSVCLGWAVWLLLLKSNKDQAQDFLGWMMVVGFVLYLSYIPYFLHRFSIFVLLLPVYTLATLLIYPMYHYYVRLLVETKVFSIWQRLYLPAVVLGILMYGTLLILNNSERENLEVILQGQPFANLNAETLPVITLLALYFISRLTFSILVIYTVILNFRLIQQYQYQLSNYYSDPENHSIKSLKYILTGMILTSVYSIVANGIGVPFFLNRPFLLIIPACSISILIFFLGYFGNSFHLVQLDFTHGEALDDTIEMELVFGEVFVANFQHRFVDNKAFLIPGLKITTLCEMLETNRTYLSVYINRTYQCNFCSLINKLRVEYSIKHLEQVSIEKYSLNYLAEMCGFSSLNTFYRTFQKEYGMTPGQFLKQQDKKAAEK